MDDGLNSIDTNRSDVAYGDGNSIRTSGHGSSNRMGSDRQFQYQW